MNLLPLEMLRSASLFLRRWGAMPASGAAVDSRLRGNDDFSEFFLFEE